MVIRLESVARFFKLSYRLIKFQMMHKQVAFQVVKIRLKHVVISLVFFSLLNVFGQNVKGFIELSLFLENSAFQLYRLLVKNSSFQGKVMLKLIIAFADVIQVHVSDGSL